MKEFTVTNFSYNGFSGQDLPGIAPYTAKFNSWTNDPGIANMDCSDEQQRLIPTFALVDLQRDDLPEQDYSKNIYFGRPSKS